MEVRYFVLSEYFGVEDDGKFTFAGVFDQIQATEYPTTLGLGVLTVVLNSKVGEPAEGEVVEIQLRGEGNDQSVGALNAAVPVFDGKAPEGMPISLFIRISVKEVIVPGPGVYYFDAVYKGTKHSVRLLALPVMAGGKDE